jgi:hypothetical protein
MMRSFGNRTDTSVVDEPFYACYLAATGLDHPGRAEVLARHETDWGHVVHWLTGPIPDGKPVWYQKHMAHHLLAGHDLDWMFQPEFQHVLLVRPPRQMLLSLSKVLGEVTIDQTGLPQQLLIARILAEHSGAGPAVLEANDVLRDPAGTLGRLCEHLGIEFQAAMLQWPAGPRDSDGVWGRYWYGRVYETTGFTQDSPSDEPLPESCQSLLARCEEMYEQLVANRLH